MSSVWLKEMFSNSKRVFFSCAAILLGGLPAYAADSYSADEGKDNALVPSSENKPGEGISRNKKNILLIICDQENFGLLASDEYKLPARERLKEKGITFENHYIAAAVCTPSRAAIFTGQPPQVNGVFDEMVLGYVPSVNPENPSLGTIMKSLGYSTAYYGKFELDRSILKPSDKVNYTDAIQQYGFDTFQPDGDKPGGQNQGYETDNYTGSELSRWLRTNAQVLNKDNKPWFTVLSFVNPHDIMTANANLPGEDIQKSFVGAKLTLSPDNVVYKKEWQFDLYSSLNEPIDAYGRPDAHIQYYKGWSAYLGYIPSTRVDMWTKFYNYYLNLIKDNDGKLSQILNTLDELDLWNNTIIIFSADHGEMAGSHGGLRNKGPFAYEQNAHVPMIIVHPDIEGRKKCKTLTSHIDLLPTIIGLSGASEEIRTGLTKWLPGKDFSKILLSPEKSPINAVRPAVLFNYTGLFTIDAEYLKYGASYMCKDKYIPSFDERRPDLGKRGFMSFVFDGRYKFARYYAPDNFNTPQTFDEIFKNNDIELFDLQNDPDEVKNLSVDSERNKDIILKMNALLNEMMEKEVGTNNGQFLPEEVRPQIQR